MRFSPTEQIPPLWRVSSMATTAVCTRMQPTLWTSNALVREPLRTYPLSMMPMTLAISHLLTSLSHSKKLSTCSLSTASSTMLSSTSSSGAQTMTALSTQCCKPFLRKSSKSLLSLMTSLNSLLVKSQRALITRHYKTSMSQLVMQQVSSSDTLLTSTQLLTND